MRRVPLVAVAVGSLFLVALVAVLTSRDGGGDDRAVPSTTSTTDLGPSPVPGPQEPGTTTTVGSVQSGGAAPVSGAILSVVVDEPGEPVEVPAGDGGEADCEALDTGMEPLGCMRAEGSGGELLVFVGRRGDGAFQSRLYRATRPGGDEFVLARRSPVFEPGGDVMGMALTEAEVGTEPVLVVDYDFDGSGAVHSFDVVAWDSSDVDPRVVAFVNGTGGDRVVRSEEAVRFVGANYEDGAPTCCPNHADVRTLHHAGPGRWEITKETVPFAQAP